MSRITGSEVKNLMEAYANVYEQQEVIDEQETVLGKKGKDWYAVTKDASGKKTGETKLDPSEIGPKSKARYERLKSQDWRSKVGQRDPATLGREAEAARKAQLARASGQREPGSTPPAPAPSPAAAPKPASPVLSKKDGVEGTGVGKDFKAKAWSDVERQRYGSAAKVSPTKPTGSAMSQWATANKPMIQKVGTPQQKDILKSVESGGKTPMPSVRPISKDIEDIRAMRTASQLRQQGAPVTSSDIKNVSIEKSKPVTVKASYEYDAYDLVLEYLLDNGHAETVDEAHYIMLEMDAQMVGDIVEGSAELSAAARKRAEALGRKRRSTKAYKQGLNRGTGSNERAAYNLSNIQRTHAANPSTQVSRSKKPAGYDTGAHKGDYERFNRSKPEKNPKHDANK